MKSETILLKILNVVDLSSIIFILFADLDSDFQKHIHEYFEKYTLPANLLVKCDNNGQQMTCEQLCSYTEIFASLMKDGMQVDDFQSFIQVSCVKLTLNDFALSPLIKTNLITGCKKTSRYRKIHCTYYATC